MPVRLPTTCYVHLATVHAHLHSAITGHCVPHYHPTETATGAHRMVTTSYLHIRYRPGTSTLDLCIRLDSNCVTTSTYKRWPMCSNKIADGAQHAHSVPNTYVHHIAHTTTHTHHAQPQPRSHAQEAIECKPKPFTSCIATSSSVKPRHHTHIRATHCCC